MAKILYGVHGTGHGHAVRALTVARHYPQHEFLFVSHSDAAALLKREYHVIECYNPETPIVAHRVAAVGAVMSTLRTWGWQPRLTRMIVREIERFQPDVAISDYEYFVPRASRVAGLPCLSLDHQHIVTCARHDVPVRQRASYAVTDFAARFLFSQASEYVVTSFYRPSPHPGSLTHLVPPLLRDSVVRQTPGDGNHVLAYHGYSTSAGFYNFLRAIQRPVRVYGSNLDRTEGNLQFKPNSEDGFLDDVTSCAYVICGAGHTLISEALHLGKPLLVIPIRGAFEQFLNAYYVEKLGYGRYHEGLAPPPALIARFEAELTGFRKNIRSESFCGNADIFRLLDAFIEMKTLCAS